MGQGDIARLLKSTLDILLGDPAPRRAPDGDHPFAADGIDMTAGDADIGRLHGLAGRLLGLVDSLTDRCGGISCIDDHATAQSQRGRATGADDAQVVLVVYGADQRDDFRRAYVDATNQLAHVSLSFARITVSKNVDCRITFCLNAGMHCRPRAGPPLRSESGAC